MGKKLIWRMVSAATIFTAVFFASAPSVLAAGTGFSLSPSSQTVTAGQSFTVAINLTTGGDKVDTVQADLTYPSNLLVCTGITNGSAFPIIPQADTCGGGNIGVQQGRFNNLTSDGVIATITFKARATGFAGVLFSSSTNAISSGAVVPSVKSVGTYSVEPVTSVPEFGLIGGIMAGTVGFGAVVLARRRRPRKT